MNATRRPAIPDGSTVERFKFDLPIHKDNSEILQITNQFEFCSDNHDITFTKDFVSRCQAVRTSANRHNTYVKVGEPENYNFRNPQLPTGESISCTITSGNNSPQYIVNNENIYVSEKIRILIHDEDLSKLENKTIYITDENNVLLLIVYKPHEWNYQWYQTVHKYWYFDIWVNTLQIRDKSVYDVHGINIVDTI